MKKTLVIGNSHVAAMKQGWDLIASDHPNDEVTFFATNSTLFQMLEINKDRAFGIHNKDKYKVWQAKFVENMFGTLTVNLDDFDQVILVGQNTNEADYLSQFEQFSIDGMHEREGKPRLSRTAYDEFCVGIAQKRLPKPQWHNWTSTPLRILPVPIPREDAPIDSEKYGVWARFADEGLGATYLEPYRNAVAQLYAGIGIEVIQPSPKVLTKSGLTKTEFGRDVGKLEGTVAEYGEGDFHHMNAKYGAEILGAILA